RRPADHRADGQGAGQRSQERGSDRRERLHHQTVLQSGGGRARARTGAGAMTEPGFDTHGVRDAATILPILAIVLIVPPLITIFAVPIRLAGIPLIVVYLFGVWALVVAAACF